MVATESFVTQEKLVAAVGVVLVMTAGIAGTAARPVASAFAFGLLLLDRRTMVKQQRWQVGTVTKTNQIKSNLVSRYQKKK